MPAVQVVPYDARWAFEFEELRQRLWPALADLASAIEHVGSTAVPGLAAKPILDIDVVMPSAVSMAVAISRLASLGYGHQGDLGVAGREAFRSPDGPPRHHLYCCREGSLALRNHLAVRDRLRADPALADVYGALKLGLAQAHPDDMGAYTEHKTAAIVGILERAGFSTDDLATIRATNVRRRAT